MVTVNKELLPVKLHYFFKAGVAGMNVLLPPLARQKGVPPEGVGMIWSLFPVFTVITMMIFTNLADRFNIHRASFITLLIAFLVAEAMICFGPDINEKEKSEYKYMDLRCGNDCSLNDNIVKSQNISMLEIIEYASFWLLLIALLMFECTNGITESLTNMATLQILGDKSHKFGLQRVWGTIGWGIMALVYGAAIDHFSQGSHMRNYSAGFIISMALWVLAFISATYIKFVNTKKKETEKGSVFDVLNSFKVIIFMACIFVIGLSMGCVWTFLFLLMEDVANIWEPGFSHLNLLQGLCISVGCFAGEVPAMFFSGAIIEYIGNIHIFTLSLAIMSTRFISYYFIRNPWLFLPVEILHSISYGLFYPNMSAYANKIAPTGRHATMQGLVSSMFKVGTSLGALIGGAGFKLFGGAQMFLYVGCADIFFMVIYVICHMLLNRRTNASGNDDENKGEINLNFKEEIPYKSHQVSTPGRGNGYGTIDI